MVETPPPAPPAVSPLRRLIDKGLMFGGLVRVESPVLVERYRRALRHLTGRDIPDGSGLDAFHVDISGFSPEVGDAIGDDAYLNRPGGQRQFILVDLDQREAPLLNAQFSTSRGILQRFIVENEAALFALTARDAVTGELVGSHHGAETLAGLLASRRVRVEADTTEGTVATAERLEGLIARFKGEPDAWWDDRLIGEMVELARRTGDLTRNPVRLKAMEFEQGNVWTARFGGLYAFRDVPEPAVLASGDPGQESPIRLIPLAETGAVARFLAQNRLAEPLVDSRGDATAAILRQKMDFIVADVLGGTGALPAEASRAELRRLARGLAGRLPPEWQGLAALVDWAVEGADWPRITSDHPAYFYTLRATPGPDADLVNQLLAELTPLDVRQLFICHKPLFYRLYRSWPEAKQAYVAGMLATEYMVDKAGTRAALFGPEPAMGAPAAPAAAGPWGTRGASPPRPVPPPLPRGRDRADRLPDDLIDRVGPWGSLGDGEMGFIRVWLALAVLLLILYAVLSVWLRLAERRRLAQEWELTGAGDDREAWMRAGMAAYDHSLRKRLLWGVVVGPLAALAVLLYVLNVS